MKTIIQLSLVLFFAAIGLSIGSAWRSRSAAAQPGQGVVAGETSNRTNAAKKRISKARRDDSPLATQLEQDLARTSGVAQWLHWMSALEKAQPSDFARLAKMARGNPAAWRLVIDRWIDVAPRQLFDTLASQGGAGLPLNELGWKLFGQWTKRDPEAAIAALNEPGGMAMKNWRSHAASIVLDNNAERGLDLFSQWHIDDFGPNMGGVAKWAAADPHHAAEFALNHPAGYASQLVAETIGTEWAKANPEAALAFAGAHPGDLGSRMATAVLKEWAGKNLDQAANWLAGTDDSTRARLSPAFVEMWAKQDAQSALSWCQDNLQGMQLAQSVSGLIKGVVAKDTSAAVAMVAAMDPSPARSEAAAIVARKLFPEMSSGEPVKPETITWLSNLDSDSIRRVIDNVTWDWATSDPKSMAKFLATLSSDQVPPYSESVLARQMVRTNPREALDWASSLPEGRAITAGSSAFVEWRFSQPDAAMSWYNSLPANDPRRTPFFDDTIRALAYQPQGADQLAAMSPADQSVAQNIISKMSIPEDQRQRLLSALKPK